MIRDRHKWVMFVEKDFWSGGLFKIRDAKGDGSSRRG